MSYNYRIERKRVIMLDIRIFENYEEISKEAAQMIKETVDKKKDAVLGLATGSTPIGLYKELIRLNQSNEIDFSDVKTVNLDEYLGLDGDHDQSYRTFMNEQLFNHINIDKKNTHVPNGVSEDPDQTSAQYDELLRELGSADIQVLGIGANGHIAFNEPNETLNINTHVTDLLDSTIEANARFFDSKDEVPKQAITMGIGSIMTAKKIILLASGSNKAAVIKQLGDEFVTTQNPATLLKLHPNVIVLVDKEAGAQL